MSRRDSQASAKSKGEEGLGRFFTQIRSWVATSEPSAQAFKQYKKSQFENAGVSIKDSEASTKLNVPASTLPDEAIKPAGPGPEPEDVARRKAELRRKMRQSCSAQSSGSRSSNSCSTRSSAPSLKAATEETMMKSDT